MTLRLLALALAVGMPCALFAQLQPTDEEAAFIYELNRARQNPQRYDAENSLGGILNGVAAQPPLALNLSLVESARWHADDMAANGYFAHQRPGGLGGQHPNWMARHKWKGSNPASAYPLVTSWTDDANYIESLATIGTSGSSISYPPTAALEALIVDAGVSPPGHRYHLLAMTAFNEAFREIGTGYSEGAGWQAGVNAAAYWAIHTGRRDADPVWLTGVVYSDANNNGRYDEGEGLSGVTVTAGGSTTGSVPTGAAGMWMMQGTAGSTTLTCSGGSFVGAATRTFTIGTANMAVDFASGRSGGELNFEFQQVGGGPVLTVSSTMNVFASPAAATPSGEQSYTVSGVRLAGNVTITAPGEFQISTTSGSGYTGSVVLTPSGGTLAGTTIYVRFNPGGSAGANGFITHDTAGAIDSPVSVVGTVSTNPAVFVSPGTLTLNAPQLGVASPEMSYTVEGYNLSGDITMTAPSDFEVSLTSGSGFSGGVVVPHSGGIVSPTTVYVRYVPSTLGASGNITNVSGANSANVALTGNVTNSPQITRSPVSLTMVSPTVGTPSGEQPFTVSGQYLGGDITLTAPAGFEITLTSGSGYAGSIILPHAGGTVASTTVYARYLGGAGGSTANLTCTSSLAANVNVTFMGQIAPPPNITLSTSMHSFSSALIGSPSNSKTYTVSGTNMIGDVTITVSGEFEVALASSGPYSPSATITVTGATLSATTVYVRYTAATPGPASGNATHSSPGATPRTLALAGSIGSGGNGTSSGDSDSGGGGCTVVGSRSSAALLALLLLIVPALARRRTVR